MEDRGGPLNPVAGSENAHGTSGGLGGKIPNPNAYVNARAQGWSSA